MGRAPWLREQLDRKVRPAGQLDRKVRRATDKKVELPESLSESRGSPLREQLDRKDHMGATRWRFAEILWYCTLGAMQSVQELETDGLVVGRLRAQGRVRNEKIDCRRFSGIASQRVEWVDPNIEQVQREAPSPSFLQEKQKYLK